MVAVDVERRVDEVEGVVVGAVVEACRKKQSIHFFSFLESGLSNTLRSTMFVDSFCPTAQLDGCGLLIQCVCS